MTDTTDITDTTRAEAEEEAPPVHLAPRYFQFMGHRPTRHHHPTEADAIPWDPEEGGSAHPAGIGEWRVGQIRAVAGDRAEWCAYNLEFCEVTGPSDYRPIRPVLTASTQRKRSR